MPSLRESRSLARMNAPRPLAIYLPSASIDSRESVMSMSDLIDTVGPTSRFDLEKTFPAILAPFSFLCKVHQSQDVDALRALAPVFCHCLDAILHSMAHLPEHVPTSPKYHLALSGVKFSKEMFLGHVSHIPLHDEPSSHKDAIQVAMQFLDMTMSGLKSFLNAAAYEVAQLKPLPDIPVEEHSDQVAETTSSLSYTGSHEGTLVPDSTDTVNPSLRSKVSTLFNPLRYGLKRKPSRLDLARIDSNGSSTAVNSNSDNPGCGYIYVSANIRNSLAQFPVPIDPTVGGSIPHPEDATELWKDRSGLAQLASLKALVRYMSSPDADIDAEIIDVFFLCFRFFSTPQETFDALVARYDEELTSPTMQSHSIQVKMRIARLLYLWVDLHWRAEDTEILAPLSQFTFSRLTKDIPQEASSKLVTSLHQHACVGDKSRGLRKERTIARAEAKYRQDMLCSTWEPREKKSMIKRDFSEVKLLHFHSPGGHAMLALQLTLLLWEKYRAFEPEDAVRHLISKDSDDTPPTSEVAQKVADFMACEKAVHRFVMDSIGKAESIQMRTETTEFFIELATKCHELRNYSASCLITLACDRPTVLPFITKLKLSPAHERMKAALMDFYTREHHHMVGYKQALQSCCCPALPGMMVFIKEVARGCGSGPYDQHPDVPGSRLINLKRYRPITWAVRAMEKCHAPFKIQRVDYICDWLKNVLSEYLVGTEVEWEQRICDNCEWPRAGAIETPFEFKILSIVQPTIIL